jgi:hypothetical protein
MDRVDRQPDAATNHSVATSCDSGLGVWWQPARLTRFHPGTKLILLGRIKRFQLGLCEQILTRKRMCRQTLNEIVSGRFLIAR